MGTGLALGLAGEEMDLGSVGWRSAGPEAKPGTAITKAIKRIKEDFRIMFSPAEECSFAAGSHHINFVAASFEKSNSPKEVVVRLNLETQVPPAYSRTAWMRDPTCALAYKVRDRGND